MNLNQMHYFVTVCDCKSFSRAAEEIYVSQPALSKQIAALETELGTQLIRRKTRGEFSLTPAGEEYLRTFRDVIRAFEETETRARLRSGGHKRIFRIGLMESWLIPGLMRACQAVATERFPDVDLQFSFLRPGEMTALREARKLDLALYRDDVNAPMEGCGWEQLRDIGGVLYVSAKNPYIEDGELQILRLKNEPLFAPPKDEMLNVEGHRVFYIMGTQELNIRERESLASIRMAILASNGYGFADEWSDVLYDPLFHTKALPDMRRGVIFSWQVGDESSLTHAMADCIRSWVADPDLTI